MLSFTPLATMKQSKLLKKLLTGSERSFISIDRAFIITDASYGTERFSETPHESLLHKDMRDVFPEVIGLEETFSSIWQNQLSSFEIKGIARSHSSANSLYFDFYIIGTNEVEEEDTNIIICIEDVTEMMNMSQILMQRANESELLANALAKSNKYIDKIISAIAESLIVTDSQGIVKTINPATENLFGYSPIELINNPIAILFKNSYQPDLNYQNFQERSYSQPANEQIENSDRCFENIEILCLSKTKEEILISFSCSTIINHDSGQNFEQTHNFVYIGRDITEFKRNQQELLAARQIAEQSAHAKSIFLANMSHEIRTPINGVIGMTELLLETSLNDRQQDFVENIRLSGDLLLSLIDQILDLSKLEAGALELESLPFDLEQWMEKNLEIFALRAHSKGLELNVNFEQGLPIDLTGDEVRLRQIIMNLISNAIKFTAKGEVFIEIERDRIFEQTIVKSEVTSENNLANNNLPQSQIYLRFSVTDTGIGINSSNQEKLFKPFSQVDASTTRNFGGTGLGLAISRQLVELMHGEISVSSPVKSEQGTCFWFRIPFRLQTQSELAPLSDENQALTNRNILVVDRNQHSRNAVRYYLTKFGAAVYEANNVEEAIACLSSTKVDAAFIDFRLANSDGTEVDFNGARLVEQIHKIPEFADMPLISILPPNHQSDIQKIAAQGFCGYITKPFKGKRLLKTMLQALKIEKSSETPSSIINPDPSILNISNFKNKTKENASINESIDRKDLKILKVLVAEDNVVNQKIAMIYLAQLGFQADLAENGEQVLELIKTKDYDIVLMDCQMPLLDGYATTQAIRQLEAATAKPNQPSEHIVIIAMTANAFKEDRDRCLAAGMDDYLTKPVRREQLKQTLAGWAEKVL